MKRPPRTLVAAGLLAAALAALLIAWFLSGWADVRARAAVVREEPTRAAAAKGAELAHELRGELGALMAREVERPYFHYQNLFHDPRSSAGVGVAPSPLANGPDDALVLGYFQLDAAGRATTPTVNEDVPELSEQRRLADNRQFRDEVVRSLAKPLAPKADLAAAVQGLGTLVASADPIARGARPGRVPVEMTNAAPPQIASTNAPVREPRSIADRAVGQQAHAPIANAPPPVPQAPPNEPEPPQQAQVVQIDPSTYAQNNMSNQVFIEQQQQAPRQRRQVRPSNAPVPQAVQTTQQANPYSQAQSLPRQPPPQQANPPPQQASPQLANPPEQASAQQAANPPAQQQAPPPHVDPPVPHPAPARPHKPRAPRAANPPKSAEPASITITVSPLEWRTLAFGGVAALVAVRQVQTPDGALSQGFVVDRGTLTSALASRAGDAIAELRAGGDDAATEVAPGWHLAMSAKPAALAAAASDASSIARGFLFRFVLVALLAAVAAALVVLLVARAERLAQERSQFAAAAAHELRTPLAGLQLYGDMLADGLGDPGKLRDYARRMSEEAARLGRVVSNVLGFSQLERGNLSVEPRVGALGDALRELAERAEPALDRAGAALALDVAPDLSARFDRDALARIVGNLLDNAEKYSRGADDRTISLSAAASADAVEITVTDHGPGITQQTRARLFRPFSRGVTSDGPAGLGLGLALSQSLAAAMGGSLDYRPSPSGGATFVLRLARA